MFGLTQIGVFHTAISLIALVTGIIALIRDGKISWKNLVGKIYVITTVIVCVTGFFIFQHGGFGKPHVLGIITLIVLGFALAAGTEKKPFRKASRYIETIGFSATFFFHLVPTFTEGLTRLPANAPLASSPDDPTVKLAIGICFILFLIGVTFQIKKLRAENI